MAARDSHPHYRDCNDDSCPRFPCRVYREGFVDGYHKGWDDGYQEGYAKGYADGYNIGFGDGLASCPGPHGGR